MKKNTTTYKEVIQRLIEKQRVGEDVGLAILAAESRLRTLSGNGEKYIPQGESQVGISKRVYNEFRNAEGAVVDRLKIGGETLKFRALSPEQRAVETLLRLGQMLGR